MLTEQQRRIVGYFIEEAKNNLNIIEQGLLNLQATINNPAMANEVIRKLDSLGISATFIGFESIHRTAIRLEDNLLRFKSISIPINRTTESLFLRIFDSLQELIEQIQKPVGLTEDKEETILANASIIFEQLGAHMDELVQMSALSSSGSLPSSFGLGDSFASDFEDAVLQELRDMLSLLSSQDNQSTRRELEKACERLQAIGEQFNLDEWCKLVNAYKLGIQNSRNSYFILAGTLFQEFRAAQELVLSGRGDEIIVPESINSLAAPNAEQALLRDQFLEFNNFYFPNTVSYTVALNTDRQNVFVGNDIEVSIHLYVGESGLSNDRHHSFQLPIHKVLGNELNVFIDSPGFQANNICSTQSIPLDSNIDFFTPEIKKEWTSRMRLTAINSGTKKIKADLFFEGIFERRIELEIKVSALEDWQNFRPSINLQARPITHPDLIIQMQSIWENASSNNFRLKYHLISTNFKLYYANNIDCFSEKLSKFELREYAKQLENIKKIDGITQLDILLRLASIGKYWFKRLLPEDLQNVLILAGRKPGFKVVLLFDDSSWIHWDWLHDGTRFLGENFIIGKWPQELSETIPYEFAVGEMNLVLEESISSCEQWLDIFEVSGAPSPNLLPAKVLEIYDSVEPIQGIHLLGSQQECNHSNDPEMQYVTSADSQKEEIQLQQYIKINLQRYHPLVTASFLSKQATTTENLEKVWILPYIRAGCSAVINTLWPVNPSVEATFLSKFYSDLWTGKSLGVAFQAARQLIQKSNPDSLDWLAYVLYGDPMAIPYRPIVGKGYALVEPVGQNIDELILPETPIRFRLSLQKAPPVWHEKRLVEVTDELIFEDLQVHVVTFGLEITPTIVKMSRTSNGNYLGWFTLTAPDTMVGESSLVQVYFADGMEPIHSVTFSLQIAPVEVNA